MNRRDFLSRIGVAGSASTILNSPGFADTPIEPPMGKADACIMIWLGGGACHVDMWDPKRKGDPKAKIAGSYYNAIETAAPGVFRAARGSAGSGFANT